jgi:hypothetical protein
VSGVGFCMCVSVSDVLLASYHHRHRQRHNYKHLRCRCPAHSLTRSHAMRAPASLPCPTTTHPQLINRLVTPCCKVSELNWTNPALLNTLDKFPDGARDLLLFVLHVLTRKDRPSSALMAAVRKVCAHPEFILSTHSHRHPIRRDCGE